MRRETRTETSAGWNAHKTVRVNRLALAVGIPRDKLKGSLEALGCMVSSQNVDIDRLNDVMKQILTFSLGETHRQRELAEREERMTDDDEDLPWYAQHTEEDDE